MRGNYDNDAKAELLTDWGLAVMGLSHRGRATGPGVEGAIRPPGNEFLATLPHLMELSYNTEFAKQLWRLIEASGKPPGTWQHEEIVAAMLKDKPPGTRLPNEISPNVAFSLLTTVADYCAFLANMVSLRNRDLTAAMRAAMSSPISYINSALSWGLGFGIEHEGSRPRYLWQWGDNGGWKNFFLAQTETQTAIAAFTNGEKGMHINERTMHAATGEDQVVFLWV